MAAHTQSLDAVTAEEPRDELRGNAIAPTSVVHERRSTLSSRCVAASTRFATSQRASHAHQHDALGIAPLADDPHTRGKCGYKLLQYAAAGTPAVGSPIGVNREILSRLGLPAAGDNGEWVEAILDLLDKSAPARATLGRRAREMTQLHYSYDAWLPRWKEAVGITDSSDALRR